MVHDIETKTLTFFTLQEVAQRSGLSEHTLRYYERIGLLDGIHRDDRSGHRRYTTQDVQKIETLACLRTTGMSIEAMRMYSALLEDGTEVADQQLALFEAQKQALERELAQKQKHLRYLEQKVAFWKAVQNDDDAKAREISEITASLAMQFIMEKKTSF